jgi:organic hydroperoxide reductase OsmC/OhrA
MNTNSKNFEVFSQSTWGIDTPISASTNKSFPEIGLSIPPEFSGPGTGYSPEDLYALALLNCYLATFKFVAEKSKLQFQAISGKAVLEVGDTESRKNWMRKVKLTINLSGAENPTRALNLLVKTKDHCMIHQSVHSEIEIDFNVE